MNPDSRRLVGKIVCWEKELTHRPAHTFVRANQGIRLGDVGLVVSQNVAELEILIKDQFVRFHISEVEAL